MRLNKVFACWGLGVCMPIFLFAGEPDSNLGIETLPEEITGEILEFLSLPSTLSLEQSSQTMRGLIQSQRPEPFRIQLIDYAFRVLDSELLLDRSNPALDKRFYKLHLLLEGLNRISYREEFRVKKAFRGVNPTGLARLRGLVAREIGSTQFTDHSKRFPRNAAAIMRLALELPASEVFEEVYKSPLPRMIFRKASVILDKIKKQKNLDPKLFSALLESKLTDEDLFNEVLDLVLAKPKLKKYDFYTLIARLKYMGKLNEAQRQKIEDSLSIKDRLEINELEYRFTTNQAFQIWPRPDLQRVDLPVILDLLSLEKDYFVWANQLEVIARHQAIAEQDFLSLLSLMSKYNHVYSFTNLMNKIMFKVLWQKGAYERMSELLVKADRVSQKAILLHLANLPFFTEHYEDIYQRIVAIESTYPEFRRSLDESLILALSPMAKPEVIDSVWQRFFNCRIHSIAIRDVMIALITHWDIPKENLAIILRVALKNTYQNDRIEVLSHIILSNP